MQRPEVNEHVGRRCRTHWPERGEWFEGVVSDYNAATREHCITYDMNTPDESFEWVNLAVRWREGGQAGACVAPPCV